MRLYDGDPFFADEKACAEGDLYNRIDEVFTIFVIHANQVAIVFYAWPEMMGALIFGEIHFEARGIIVVKIGIGPNIQKAFVPSFPIGIAFDDEILIVRE